MIRTKEFKSKPYITEEMIERVASVMREGTISGFRATEMEGGRYVQEFEKAWAKYHKVKYAISVNSATSGLITALKALEIDRGDEVITSPFSFSASWSSIKLAGATPVFADIDIDTMCIDEHRAYKLIKGNTSIVGLIYVDWNSNTGCSKGLAAFYSIIEDMAQCAGTPHQGYISVYSLNQPKNITTGEGGIITTNNEELARRCKLIRNHGENIDPKWTGYNFRLTEIQAVIGIEQLKHLKWLNEIRHRNWLYLIKELEEYQALFSPQKIICPDSYSPYCIAFRWLKGDRDNVANKLRAEGIPCVTGVNYLPASLPNADKLQSQYLGFYQVGWPNTEEDMQDIIKGFRKVIDG